MTLSRSGSGKLDSHMNSGMVCQVDKGERQECNGIKGIDKTKTKKEKG